jgi:hypothetical protein
MTNSHNKSLSNTSNGKSTERFFHNNSPHQAAGHQQQQQQYQQMNNNKSRCGRLQKSPTSKYFNSISAASNPIPINRGGHHFTNNHHRYDLNSHHNSSYHHHAGGHSQHNNNNHSRSHNSFFMSAAIANNTNNNSHQHHTRSSPGGSCSPPNFSHFAGSKCYDAPTADTLPQPPRHWTKTTPAIGVMQTCAQASAKSKRFDDFSHNLRMILNVQA